MSRLYKWDITLSTGRGVLRAHVDTIQRRGQRRRDADWHHQLVVFREFKEKLGSGTGCSMRALRTTRSLLGFPRRSTIHKKCTRRFRRRRRRPIQT